MPPNRATKLYLDLSPVAASVVQNPGLSRTGLTLTEIGVGWSDVAPSAALICLSRSPRALLRLHHPAVRSDPWDPARERSLCDGRGCPNLALHRSRLRRIPLGHRTCADACRD